MLGRLGVLGEDMAQPIVPPFPSLGEPGEWPTLILTAATVFLEAEAEPWDGVLGVAWCVRRRALDWKLGWHAALLGPEGLAYDDGKDFEPFSCWNTDYRPRALARLSTATPEATELSWKAAAAALWDLLPDPVNGAASYLNVPVTLRIRGGNLPAWAADPRDASKVNQDKVRAVVGRHVFLA